MQFHAERIKGEVRSTLGELVGSNVVGPIRISSGSHARDIKLNDFSQGLEVDLKSGDIELNPGSMPLGRMDVRTRHGNIELTLPEKAKFDLKGTTKRGEATNDWGDALKQESDKHGSMLSGIVGQGPALSLTTEFGGFTIHKATLAPAPAQKEVSSGAPPAPPTPPVRPEVRVE